MLRENIKNKAKEVFAKEFNKNPKKVSFTSFNQTFPDTACLFKENSLECAGQAFTTVCVSVLYDKTDNIVLVFQNEHPVYGLSGNFNKKLFWKDVRNNNVKPFYLAHKYQ